MMDPLTCVMEKLYESEINCRIESFFDAGWSVSLGDHANGFKEVEVMFYSMDAAAAWLHGAALKHYPDSDYAKFYKDSPPWNSYDSDKFEDAVKRVMMKELSGI